MQIFGHRGAAGEAPENTVAGILHAINIGIHYFEIDLRLSADHQLVVLHDSNLMRTAGIDKNVFDIDADSLSKVRVDIEKKELVENSNNQDALFSVPTLAQLLKQCQPIEKIQLEIKSDETVNKHNVITQLGKMFPDKASTINIVATSFDSELLAMLKAEHPHIPIGLINHTDTQEAIDTALRLNCSYLCLQRQLTENWDTKINDQLANSDMHISIWTVNEEDDWHRLKKLPVHSIITDYPSKMLALKNTDTSE